MSETKRVIVSGDWLVKDLGNTQVEVRWAVGYVARVSPRDFWSGGVVPHVTREVAEAIIEQQNSAWQRGIGAELLTFVGDVLVIASPEENEIQQVEADGNGLYAAPSWAWHTVEAKDCDVVVGVTEADVREQFIDRVRNVGLTTRELLEFWEGEHSDVIGSFGDSGYPYGEDLAEVALKLLQWIETLEAAKFDNN